MIEFLLLMSAPLAPSFDCVKANLAVEKMICADPDLALRDRALALIYESVLKTFPNVRKVQREWLRNERNACSTTACVRQAYDRRIALWAGSSDLADYWRHEGYVGGLTIAPVAGDWHIFWVGAHGDAATGEKFSSAEFAGLVRIRDGVGRWRQGPSCSLEIARTGRRWRVEQSPGCAPILSGLTVDGDYFTEADWWREPGLPTSRR